MYFTKATLRGFWKLNKDPPEEFVNFLHAEQKHEIGYLHYGMTKLGTWRPNKQFEATPMSSFMCGKWRTVGSSTRR